jgi:hypothetical protein
VRSPVIKIFEKVIYHRLLTFINKHKLLSNFQFGVREKSSMAATMSEIVDEILNERYRWKENYSWSVLGLEEGI